MSSELYIDVAILYRSSFALEADISFGGFSLGFIEQHAVDRGRNVTALADNDSLVPLSVRQLGDFFAERFLAAERTLDTFEFQSAEQKAEIAFAQLQLDTSRPDFVLILQENEDAAVHTP